MMRLLLIIFIIFATSGESETDTPTVPSRMDFAKYTPAWNRRGERENRIASKG